MTKDEWLRVFIRARDEANQGSLGMLTLLFAYLAKAVDEEIKLSPKGFGWGKKE